MEKVIAKLDSIHDNLMNLVTPMSDKEFSERPSPDRWSVAENIHHLYLVESKYVDLIEEAMKSGEKISLFRKLIQVPPAVASVRLVRVKVPVAAVEPLNPPPKADVINNFNKIRARSKSLLKEHSEALQNLPVPHPFFGIFDGVNAIRFVGYHELRHYKQIVEMLQK